VLQLIALGESDAARFPWLDAPRPEAIAQSVQLLEQLGLLDKHALTDLGRAAAGLPVHPRLSRLLLEGRRLGYPDRAALAAALLSERDPFLREFDSGPPVRTAPPTVSDVLDRVEALEAFESTGRLDGPLGRLHRGGAHAVLEVRDQLALLIRNYPHPPAPSPRGEGEQNQLPLSPGRGGRGVRADDDDLLRCIFAAYPDRLARRREPGSTKALTVGGRGVRLAPTSGVSEPELLVCVD